MIGQRANSLYPVPAHVHARRRPAEPASRAAEPSDGDILAALRYALPLGIGFWGLVFLLILS